MSNSAVNNEAKPAGPENLPWFAGMAMQAMIAKNGIPESQSAREEIALWSFRMGEAMIAMDHRLHDE